MFPDYTGGRTVLNTNAPQAVVSAIFDESQSYYLIGVPRESTHDVSERRKVRVTVKNRPELEVRARTGYYAGAPAREMTPRDALDAAVSGLLPKTDIPLRLGLTPQFRPDGLVVSPLVDFDAAPPGTSLDVLVAVVDDKARPVVSQRQVVQLPAGVRAGSVMLEQVSLEPGHYEVRVGVQPQATGPTATPERELVTEFRTL